MDVLAPTLLASYAYQQAGGGSYGVLAALDAINQSGLDAAALVQSAGPVAGSDALQASQNSGLEVGTFRLLDAGGLGAQALQALLNPPLSFANPFLNTQSYLSLNAAAAYAGYLYAQAQRAGLGAAYTQYALNSALDEIV